VSDGNSNYAKHDWQIDARCSRACRSTTWCIVADDGGSSTLIERAQAKHSSAPIWDYYGGKMAEHCNRNGQHKLTRWQASSWHADMKLSHHAMSILKALPFNIARNDSLPFILVIPFSIQYISRNLSGMRNSLPCRRVLVITNKRGDWCHRSSKGIVFKIEKQPNSANLLHICVPWYSDDFRLCLSGIRIPCIHAFHVSSDLAPSRWPSSHQI
jgi:hypothetical protein